MDTLFATPAPTRALGDIRALCRPIGIELVVAARGRLADEDILGSPPPPPPPLRDVPCGVPEARFLSIRQYPRPTEYEMKRTASLSRLS